MGKVLFSAELVVGEHSCISDRVNVPLRRSKPCETRVPAV